MQRTNISWWKTLTWVGVLFLTLAFLYAVRTILLPFVLAFIIAVLLDPVIQKLRRRGWSRKTAIGVVMGTFFLIAGVFLLWLIPKMSTQVAEFSSRIESVVRTVGTPSTETVYTRWHPAVIAERNTEPDMIDSMLHNFSPVLSKLGLPTSKRVLIEQYVEPQRGQIATQLKSFLNGFVGIIFNAGSQVLMLLFTPIFVWMMLGEFESFKVKGAYWIPASIRAESISLLRDVGQVFLNFLRGQTISVCVYAAIMSVLFSLLGVPFGVLLGILAGVIYLIPLFGSLISAAIVFVVTWLQGSSHALFFEFPNAGVHAGFAVAIFFVVHLVYDNMVNPRLVGGSVGLNMLVSMFAVFASGALFGIPGMILAFPIAGSVKVILARLLRATTTATPDTLRLPNVPLRHRSTIEV